MTVDNPLHFVSHSYGTFVCLILAMQYQSLVRSLGLAEHPVITLFVCNSPKPVEILKHLFSRPKTAGAIMKCTTRVIGPAPAAVKCGNLEKVLEISGKASLGNNDVALNSAVLKVGSIGQEPGSISSE